MYDNTIDDAVYWEIFAGANFCGIACQPFRRNFTFAPTIIIIAIAACVYVHVCYHPLLEHLRNGRQSYLSAWYWESIQLGGTPYTFETAARCWYQRNVWETHQDLVQDSISRVHSNNPARSPKGHQVLVQVNMRCPSICLIKLLGVSSIQDSITQWSLVHHSHGKPSWGTSCQTGAGSQSQLPWCCGCGKVIWEDPGEIKPTRLLHLLKCLSGSHMLMWTS